MTTIKVPSPDLLEFPNPNEIVSGKKNEELKYNNTEYDVKEQKSFMVEKNRFNHSIPEVNFFENHHIKWSNLNSRWEWMNKYPDLIAEFYRAVIFTVHKRTPTIPEIKIMGYKTFIEKIPKLTGKSFNQWVSDQG